MGKEGKGGTGGEDRGGEGEGGEGKGREGTPQYFIAPPQFQFSRNMPGTTDAATTIIHVHHLSSAYSVLVMVQLRAKCLASSVPSSKNKRRSPKP